jgi:hypothetical protein
MCGWVKPVLEEFRESFTAASRERSEIIFFSMKEELYYRIAGYINTLQALWITK